MKVPKLPPGLSDRRPLAGGALIVWVAVSPFIWGFADKNAAVANHVFLVFSFGPMVMMIASLRAAAIVTIAGGFWLALSPLVLGYAGDHQAWLNELVTGLLLVALSAGAAGIHWPASRRRAARPLTPAGVATADQPGTQG
jgi:SPW repeat